MAEPFRGWIASTGTTSGLRVVIGSWDEGPLGRVDDVLLTAPDGRRLLCAPTAELAAEITGRYTVDEVALGDVEVLRGTRRWFVRAPSLELELTIGRRTALGAVLRAVPPPLRERQWWAALCDPVARRLLPGVRTLVRSRDQTLWYAARDHRRVVAVSGRWQGRDVGSIAAVDPPVDYGGSSAPASPSLTRLSSHRRAPGLAD